MIILRVGDLHVKPSNLEESQALLNFILQMARTYYVDIVELSGDIFDTHNLVRLDIIEFWDRWFNIFTKEKFKTRVLVGNHDLTGSYNSTYSALHPFLSLENSNFKIVHEPYLDGIYGYLPYIHDDNKFIVEANKLADQGATVLMSHPNFKGAVYDSGMAANGGVDSTLLDSRFLHLVSGHIHTEISYDRVWYIGTPRWLTKSCSNKQKGIWLCVHDENGLMTSKEFLSTESVCTKIVSLEWKEGEAKPEIPENAKVDIELIGSSDWVKEQKIELKGQVSISSKLTDVKKVVRKSGGSLHEFILKYYQTDENKRAKLLKYMENLNLV